jgi:uncharacterized protein
MVTGMILFEWDETKAEANLRKHSISFLDAMEVFRDPYAIAEQDWVVDGELRWRTIGMVDGLLVLFVAHTVVDEDEVEMIRVISARKATRKERIRYGQNRKENVE